MSRARWTAVLGAVALTLILAAPGALAQKGTVGVFQPGTRPYGMSYGDWSAAWWQWAYSLPVDQNPLFDETGALAGQGQSGPVFFLAGVFNVTGTAERTCNVPVGKAILFPILNTEWDNYCPPATMSQEELLAQVNAQLDQVSSLECQLDGIAITNLTNFRTTSGAFDVTFPDNNLFQLFGCDVPAGNYPGFVSGGYYVMLTPLAKGAHTLHFHGGIGDPPFFALDITYHLNVVNPAAPPPSQLSASIAPNPLNPVAKLTYSLPRSGAVRIGLYDAAGRLVRTILDEPMVEAGRHVMVVEAKDGNGRTLSSGVYYYRIDGAGGTRVGRFAVVK